MRFAVSPKLKIPSKAEFLRLRLIITIDLACGSYWIFSNGRLPPNCGVLRPAGVIAACDAD